ncbi:MAG TPA: peptidoglycan DD-metalloendopeptidase family protein [Vicinamibacteria bacterium]|nr:peptidoglycan DD-metalloendopeptidase family protein [Vicinamibacteria bacterium]
MAAAQGPPPPSPETPNDDRLRRVQERRASLAREVARLRAEERSLLGEVERLELEVRLRTEELRETQLLLQRTNAELDSTAKKAREVAAAVEAARPLLRARARDLYKLGEVSYLRLLLSVERPADFLNGYRHVTTLARRDNERISRFRSDLETLRATRAELEEKTRAALALRAQLERTRRQLDTDRQRKTELLTSIVQRKETNAAYVQELEQAEARLQGLIAGLAPGDLSVPPAAFKGTLPWPAPGRVRVPFGLRKHVRFDTYTVQNGVELATPEGSPVMAVYEGRVVFVDRFKGYGLMVVVDHGGKHHTLYAHLAEVSVEAGQAVVSGQELGLSGSGLEGPGVYFEVRFQGKPEDPVEWLRKEPER